MKAVFVEQPGGPENLRYADLPKPAPGSGQALVKIAATGVNFIDIYFRNGLYKADPPVVLGNEAAGTGGPITWTGRPPRAPKVVRSVSWRRTTSPSAALKPAVWSGPARWSAMAM